MHACVEAAFASVGPPLPRGEPIPSNMLPKRSRGGGRRARAPDDNGAPPARAFAGAAAPRRCSTPRSRQTEPSRPRHEPEGRLRRQQRSRKRRQRGKRQACASELHAARALRADARTRDGQPARAPVGTSLLAAGKERRARDAKGGLRRAPGCTSPAASGACSRYVGLAPSSRFSVGSFLRAQRTALPRTRRRNHHPMFTIATHRYTLRARAPWYPHTPVRIELVVTRR